MKINKYTTKTITEGMSIELDPEDFRNIEPAYTGDSNEDFLDYLENLEYNFDDAEIEDEDLRDKLEMFFLFTDPVEVDDSSLNGKEFDTIIVEEDTWDEKTFEWVINEMPY